MFRGSLLIVLMLCLPFGQAMASRAPDFALIDQNGRFHQLSRYSDKEVVVLAAHQAGCAKDDSVLLELASLQQRFRGEAVSFQVVVPDPDESRQSLKRLAARLETDLPFLLDSSQLITDALSFTRCGEILVVDPARLEVVYRGGGGLYDDHPLQLALAATIHGLSSHLHYIVHSELRGEPFIQDIMPVDGESLRLDALGAARARSVSYEEDVAPILKERCLDCHKEQGAAPWVMSGHQMVQGWSQMIRETLLTRRMPPGQIDYEHADRFDDVHHISDDEMSTLLTWIEKGARRDPGQADPLDSVEADSSDWELGEPDMIVEFPPHEIPATGVLDYMFVPIELGLMEDKWVQAYEFDVDD